MTNKLGGDKYSKPQDFSIRPVPVQYRTKRLWAIQNTDTNRELLIEYLRKTGVIAQHSTSGDGQITTTYYDKPQTAYRVTIILVDQWVVFDTQGLNIYSPEAFEQLFEPILPEG